MFASPGRGHRILMWGVDHHRADTAQRELAALDGDRADAFLAACRERGLWPAVLVSTCNRSEIYVECGDPDAAELVLGEILSGLGVDVSLFAGELGLRLRDLAAVEHLYRVAAGLDSMMLGEPQIAGQVRDAWRRSQDLAPLGSALDRAFRGSFKTSKCVRSGTRLGKGAVSVAFAAVELSRKFFQELGHRHGLLLGAGETGSLAGRHFVDAGLGELCIVNRSAARAQRLAEILGAKSGTRCAARPFGELAEALADADLVLCSTSAPDPIVTPELLGEVRKRRKGRPLCLLDIAVPRDVDPAVAELPETYLFGLDDLDEIVQANLEARRRELPRAEKIIDKELGQFERFLGELALKPTLGSFHAFLESIKEGELERQKGKVDDATHRSIEASLQTFIQRVMYRPAKQLRRLEEQRFRESDLDSLRRLFELECREAGSKDQLTE